MARYTPASDDDVVRLVETNLAAAGAVTAAIVPAGRFSITVSGVFVAQLIVSRSFDGGATFVPCGALGQPVVYTGPVSEDLTASGEHNVQYRVEMPACTSGSAHVRLSQ